MERIITAAYLFGTVAVVVFKVIRIVSMQKGKGPDQWKAIVRYCCLYYALNLGIMITEPYIFQHMIESGTTPEEITAICAVPFCIKAIFRFIPLRVIKMAGVPWLLIGSGVVSSVATLLRTKKNFDALCVSQVAISMSRETFLYAMSDWKLGEGSHEKNSDAFFHAVVSTVHTVMAAIIALVSKQLHSVYEEKQLYYIGTVVCLAIIPASLVTIKKKPYPFRHAVVKPGKTGTFAILFFTIFETHFTPRTLQYISTGESTIPLEYLFSVTLTMQFLADTVVGFFNITEKAPYVFAAVSAILGVLSFVMKISFSTKSIVFIVLMIGTVLAKVGRYSLEYIGNTPIENSAISVSFAYLAYKLFSTDIGMNIKICIVTALLSSISSILYIYKGPNNDPDESENNIL